MVSVKLNYALGTQRILFSVKYTGVKGIYFAAVNQMATAIYERSLLKLIFAYQITGALHKEKMANADIKMLVFATDIFILVAGLLTRCKIENNR